MQHIPIDLAALYQDRRVPVAPRGNKHYREGWINTHCPFCTGSRNFHLGYNLTNDYFYCWRCGWKPQITALAEVLNISEHKVRALLSTYKVHRAFSERADATISGRPIRTCLPKKTRPLSRSHEAYLRSRGFNPNELVEMWGLKGTDHTAEPRWQTRQVPRLPKKPGADPPQKSFVWMGRPNWRHSYRWTYRHRRGRPGRRLANRTGGIGDIR